MIAQDIQNEILHRLRQAESEHQVRILFAIESGSRAWGFASPNSDYDVRFIYAHPRDWYLRIDLEEQRDVIEYGITDDIDLNGWDIRKALRLFWKTNPAFIEWIQSPIHYMHKGIFLEKAKHLLPTVYCAHKGIQHYRSMAKTNYRGYLKEDWVPLKKYFYALRPLLAVKWIEQNHAPPPIEFEKLLTVISDRTDLMEHIQILLSKKRNAPELGTDKAIPALNAFIEQELVRLEAISATTAQDASTLPLLNELFRQIIAEDI